MRPTGLNTPCAGRMLLQFDEDLRSRNPLYGLRDLQGEILPLAEEQGLQLEEVMRLARGNVSTYEHRLCGRGDEAGKLNGRVPHTSSDKCTVDVDFSTSAPMTKSTGCARRYTVSML